MNPRLPPRSSPERLRVTTVALDDFSLLEALLWDGQYSRLAQHLQRMARSAATFAIPFDGNQLQSLLLQHAQTLDASERYKVRLEVDRAGAAYCASAVLSDQAAEGRLTIVVSERRTRSGDLFLFHKTTYRPLYQEAYQRAVRHGHTDVIFLNERDEVTEGAISNIFIQRRHRLLTPPSRCGLLAGVYRQMILDERPDACEQVLSLEDLREAEQIYLCNAVRGWRPVTLATS
jgi:para-aminobenzoate synthetase/4-amino-4-deoxychorismate lyase